MADDGWTVIDGRVLMVVDFAGQVCSTGNVGLINVSVRDDSGTPDDSTDDQTFAIGTLAAGSCAPYSGSYFPTGVNTPDPSFAVFSDTVTATGTARLGFGTATETRSATCPLCPPQ